MSTEFESASPLRRRLSVLMSVGVLAVGGGAVAGCGGDEESPDSGASGGGQQGGGQQDGGQQQIPASGVTLADILSNPQQYTGQQVTVEGEIAQIVDEPGVFTIGEGGVDVEGVQDAGGELLVLPTQGAQATDEEISAGNILSVQGTVQIVSANIAEENDFLFEEEGDTSSLEQFQDQPVVIATQVEWDAPAVLEEGQESPTGE